MSQLSEQNQDLVKNSQSLSNKEKDKDLSPIQLNIEDDEETIAVANNPKFLEILEHSRQRHKTERGISLEEMRERLGIKSTEGDKQEAKGNRQEL